MRPGTKNSGRPDIAVMLFVQEPISILGRIVLDDSAAEAGRAHDVEGHPQVRSRPIDDPMSTLPGWFSSLRLATLRSRFEAERGLGRSLADRPAGIRRLERVKGIEPSYSAWKAAALPLSYTRASTDGLVVGEVGLEPTKA